jgi:hypothetical protein
MCGYYDGKLHVKSKQELPKYKTLMPSRKYPRVALYLFEIPFVNPFPPTSIL